MQSLFDNSSEDSYWRRYQNTQSDSIRRAKCQLSASYPKYNPNKKIIHKEEGIMKIWATSNKGYLSNFLRKYLCRKIVKSFLFFVKTHTSRQNASYKREQERLLSLSNVVTNAGRHIAKHLKTLRLHWKVLSLPKLWSHTMTYLEITVLS